MVATLHKILADVLVGTSQNETFTGSSGDDRLTGGGGNDTFTGNGGKDVYVYDARNFGHDVINDFVVGKDKLDLSALHIADIASLIPYVSSNNGDLTITFEYNSQLSQGIEQIKLIDVDMDALLASPSSFVFYKAIAPLNVTGTFGADVLFGGKGNDTVTGLESDDYLNGGAGNDTLVGGKGNDTLFGGSGKDVFVYNNRFFGKDVIADFRIGRDKIDLAALGVADLATLRPYMSQDGANVVITTFANTFFSDTKTITIANVKLSNLLHSPESFIFNTSAKGLIEYGDNGADSLFGGKGTDKLYGLTGNDYLSGGSGDDKLVGGSGNDTLFGGAGNDKFFFDVGDGHDSIEDFRRGDKIDFKSIDPSSALGDQALTFVSGNFTAAGQVLIDAHDGIYTVYVNLDDRLDDAELVIDVHSTTPLTVQDLVL